jgi:hypothetical protein
VNRTWQWGNQGARDQKDREVKEIGEDAVLGSGGLEVVETRRTSYTQEKQNRERR